MEGISLEFVCSNQQVLDGLVSRRLREGSSGNQAVRLEAGAAECVTRFLAPSPCRYLRVLMSSNRHHKHAPPPRPPPLLIFRDPPHLPTTSPMLLISG